MGGLIFGMVRVLVNWCGLYKGGAYSRGGLIFGGLRYVTSRYIYSIYTQAKSPYM